MVTELPDLEPGDLRRYHLLKGPTGSIIRRPAQFPWIGFRFRTGNCSDEETGWKQQCRTAYHLATKCS